MCGLATHTADAGRIVAFSPFGEVYVTDDAGASRREIAREFGEIRTAIWVPNWIFIVVNKKPRGRGIANADCGPLFRGPIAPGEEVGLHSMPAFCMLCWHVRA